MAQVRMWRGVVVVGLLGVLAVSGHLERRVGVAGADSAVKKVEYDKGQTLTGALQKAKPGDTLQATGTCQERVTITTDRLSLGGGGAVFAVKDTTIQNNAGGIFLNNNASAEFTDVEVKDSGAIGIAVQNTSTAVLKGNISSTGSISHDA